MFPIDFPGFREAGKAGGGWGGSLGKPRGGGEAGVSKTLLCFH